MRTYMRTFISCVEVYDVSIKEIWSVWSRYGMFHCRSITAEDAAPRATTVMVARNMEHCNKGIAIFNQPVQGAVSICISSLLQLYKAERKEEGENDRTLRAADCYVFINAEMRPRTIVLQGNSMDDTRTLPYSRVTPILSSRKHHHPRFRESLRATRVTCAVTTPSGVKRWI